MISLQFTLYRFVCDVTTFTSLFAPDAEGRRIPDTSAFICQWSRVPRRHPTPTSHNNNNNNNNSNNNNLLLLDASGAVGNTPAFFFKAQGPDMTLSFSSAKGSLEIDGDAAVIAFAVRPTHYTGGPTPVVAKGTLDPIPYLGKPTKNYAIKLRDAAGQVVGKLLFAMQAREVEEEEEEKNTTVEQDQHQHQHRQDSVTGLNKRSISPNYKLDLNKLNNNDINNDNNNGLPLHRNRGRETSHSPPQATSTKQNSLEPSPSRDYEITHSSVPVSRSSPNINLSGDKGVEKLEINIEKIVIKMESIDLDNPAPLLLGGMYYLKVRYGTTTSSTKIVECQNPKEIIYGHLITLTSLSEENQKIRFSLWEDDRQVAGFSLDPVKFRVSPGSRKEYSIPFRYYPTQQSASLEVTVHRLGTISDENKRKKIIIEKDDVKQVKEEIYQPNSILTRRTMKFHEEEDTPKTTSTNIVSRTRETSSPSSLSYRVSSTEAAGYQRNNSAKEYVQKRYNDSNIRQSHWDNATQQQQQQQQQYRDRERESRLQEEENDNNNNNHNNNIVVANTNSSPSTMWEDQRNENINKKVGTLQINQPERRMESENPNRMYSFLEQIAHRNTRSSSATRRPTEGLEVPKLTPNQRDSISRNTGTNSNSNNNNNNNNTLRYEGRSSTPLKNRNNNFGWRGDGIDSERNSYSERTRDLSSSSSWRRPNNNTQHQHQTSHHLSFNEPVIDGGISFNNNNNHHHHHNNNTRERLADSLLSRLERQPGFRTSLMEDWLEWRETRTSARVSRAGSVHSAFSRDESVDSISSRNRAASPLPTKSINDAAEQKPYQPKYIRRSISANSAASGRPPLPMR